MERSHLERLHPIVITAKGYRWCLEQLARNSFVIASSSQPSHRIQGLRSGVTLVLQAARAWCSRQLILRMEGCACHNCVSPLHYTRLRDDSRRTTTFKMCAACEVHALGEPKAGNALICCGRAAIFEVSPRCAGASVAVDVRDAGLADVACEDDV